MKLFVRAVVTGFALSLGAALFKKVQTRLGLADKDAKPDKDGEPNLAARDGATDPGLRQQHELS
jgi:hypothetical protein